MPSATFLSPHLDDAAFSAGATLARLCAQGWNIDLVTVFTRSVPDPTGFALACQLDKGLPPEADYMAIRRAEDLAAAAALGLPPERVHHLDLPEAPHRGYHDAAALFTGLQPADRGTKAAVSAAVRGFLGNADRVYLPLGLGHHVDHLLVIAAAEELVPAERRRHWLDTPYVLRCSEDEQQLGETEDAAAWLPQKLEACAAYLTQLPFQFGGEAAMRETLSGLAERFVKSG